MKFKGDIIITDPCYISNNDRWWNNGYFDIFTGKGLDKFGFTNYLYSPTEYGDWSCLTLLDILESKNVFVEMKDCYFKFFKQYNNHHLTMDQKKEIYKEYIKEREELNKNPLILGRFCADSGLVAVFLLNEVLKFNSEFKDHIDAPQACTWIKDFDGEIDLVHINDEIFVKGKGNINFYTTQIEF